TGLDYRKAFLLPALRYQDRHTSSWPVFLYGIHRPPPAMDAILFCASFSDDHPALPLMANRKADKERPCHRILIFPTYTSLAVALPVRKPHGNWRRQAFLSSCMKCARCAVQTHTRPGNWPNLSAPTPSVRMMLKPMRSACCTRKCALPVR